MTLKKLKSILKLVIKDEINASVIEDLEAYILVESGDYKTTIQQLQQLSDKIERLELNITNNKRNYQEAMYYKIIDEIDSLMDDIKNETLILKNII